MRSLIICSTILLVLVSCAKKEKVMVLSVPYKAKDGSRAKATFTSTENSRTVMIEANNQKYQLDYKSKTNVGDIFERNGMRAETKGDSLFISDDKQIISLVKDK